ncbi:MAG: low molecular weight phosphatase family protein [Bryobacteraceae bacterium]|nr:low molecular weight phosphatase family protein [Bryobacteraceae bacterium]
MKKPRVLFVCIGNACRSPMAWALARARGADVMEVESAGLAPAVFVPELTLEVMKDRGIDASDHWPRSFREVDASRFDLVVNMSGHPIRCAVPVRNWDAPDPIGGDKQEYERTAALIERLVGELLEEFRAKRA